jgi:hypothetical protein
MTVSVEEHGLPVLAMDQEVRSAQAIERCRVQQALTAMQEERP